MVLHQVTTCDSRLDWKANRDAHFVPTYLAARLHLYVKLFVGRLLLERTYDTLDIRHADFQAVQDSLH